MNELAKVRIEIGEHAIFTRVYIDDVELRGVTRIWFDSGDVNDGDKPRKSFAEHTRVHVEFYPKELLIEGTTEVSGREVRRAKVGAA